ncbi:MAG: glycosyltransferase family 9 protein [Phycisphaerales bacterium]|nr:glycosyltransferase family 9 protein [Phycisphaerales bacterium]
MTNDSPERILFIRPSALGDVCRSVPVVASLHAAFPDAAIDWLVQSEFIDAVSEHPALRDVIPFPRRELQRWYTPSGFKKVKSLTNTLKQASYDLVIDGQGLGRSGMLALSTCAKQRIGPDHAREFGWLGYTNRVQTTSPHTVDNMLELIESIGVQPVKDMRLYTPPYAEAWWSEYRAEHGVHDYVVLAPTSRWSSKQWPVERFCTVAHHLQSLGKQVVVVGAPNEEEQINELIQLDGVINVLPELSVGGLMAVVSHSELLIGNDSAAIHIGVGYGVPLIALYGPTNPIEVGPYGQLSSVISAPVNYSNVHFKDHSIGESIMKQIDTETVVQRTDDLLGMQ